MSIPGCRALVPGSPSAGCLCPVALRMNVPLGTVSLDNLPLLDALVTKPLAATSYIAFRFFPPVEGYLSTNAVTVGFYLGQDLWPGSVLRVQSQAASAGTALVCLEFPGPCAGSSPVVTTLATTPTVLQVPMVGWSCFLYSVPSLTGGRGKCCTQLTAIAAISGNAVSAWQYLPPTCILPCQFTVVPLPLSTSTINPLALVAYASPEPSQAAVPQTWAHAWQTIKFGPWSLSTDSAAFVGIVQTTEASLYLAPGHGAMIPVAYRPHAAGSPVSAQLVLAVTERIAAGTTLAISADLSTGPSSPAPFWLWTAPLAADVLPGAVVSLCNLGVVAGTVPTASLGYVSAVFTSDVDLPLTDFTVFAQSLCAGLASSDVVASRRFVTALYTCARGPGQLLPDCLVAGQDMPAAPWPAMPAVLPVASECAGAPPVSASLWPCFRNTLCHMTPVAWSCQPVPWFAIVDPCLPRPACCVDNQPSGSVPRFGRLRTTV